MKRPGGEKMWGGRFGQAMDPGLFAFSRSLPFDARLLEADARASGAHARALVRAGVLTPEEGERISSALEEIVDGAQADPEAVKRDAAEDVHSFLEAQLCRRLGDLGRKLHAGRSRNDQVATALRLWMRKEVDAMQGDLRALERAFIDHAEANIDAVMPGYTHLQRAQPILWAHWCLAYVAMLGRDDARLVDLLRRVNVLPLGSGALAGTSFPIDRGAVACELGFDTVSENSLDAVGDRDFCVEFASASALIMMHLSRCAEDLVLFASAEFGFVELGDAVATGSSLMPQKKNPDVLELVRGKCGRVMGHLTALLTVMKGLPLAYNKDLQEDKEAVFDCADTVQACVKAVTRIMGDLHLRKERMRSAAESGYQNATELADELVRKGVPFREAHEAVGKIVTAAIEQGLELGEMPFEAMQALCPQVGQDVFKCLTLAATLGTKAAVGGTAPGRVREALKAARKRLNLPTCNSFPSPLRGEGQGEGERTPMVNPRTPSS